MRETFLLLLSAALAMFAPGAGAEPRVVLSGVSSIRIANYGAPSVLVDRENVRPVVEELNQLRRKDWQKGDVKMRCYSTVVLLKGDKNLAIFRIRPEVVVDRYMEKGQMTWNLTTGPDDLPKLRKLLAEIPPAKDCE